MSDPQPEHTTRRGDLRRAEAATPGRRAPPDRRLPTLPTISVPKPTHPAAVTQAGTRAGGKLRRRTERAREVTRPAWQPLVSFLRWVAPLGWAVLALGVVCWMVGAWLDWAEFSIVAVAALVLLALCVLLAVGHTRVRIETSLDPLRVTVGDPATGRIEVTNDARRPMLPLLVELPVGVSAARFTLPPLGSGKTHEELFVVPTERRGVIPVGPARTVQGDPLGLVRRTERWTDITELFVHPRTISIESLGAGLLRDLEGETTQDLSMSDLAFHALREYQPGDDRRYIHWRSSAKAGRLLVRQFLDTRRSHLCLVVDVDPAQYRGGEEDVETGISAAASLAVRAIMDEQDTTVACRDERASRTTASLTLDTLARVEVGAHDLFSLAGDASALAPDTSVALLVTGANRSFIEVQRALGQFAHEVHKVVLTVDPRQQVGVKTVAGLTMMGIRELTDLRAVLIGGIAA
jgi:uncharacterized protein (DUF58 family)